MTQEATTELSLLLDAGSAWTKGIATLAVPMFKATLLSLLVKRNWKVMSSLASPLLSRWIS